MFPARYEPVLTAGFQRLQSSDRRAGGGGRRCGLAATLKDSQPPSTIDRLTDWLIPVLYNAASPYSLVSAEQLGKRTTTVIVVQIRAREVTFCLYQFTKLEQFLPSFLPSSLHAIVTLVVHDGNGPRRPSQPRRGGLTRACGRP